MLVSVYDTSFGKSITPLRVPVFLASKVLFRFFLGSTFTSSLNNWQTSYNFVLFTVLEEPKGPGHLERVAFMVADPELCTNLVVGDVKILIPSCDRFGGIEYDPLL